MVLSGLRQGDIIMLDNAPKPEHNHEQKGYRPWLVVSDPFLTVVTPFAWVIPFTSEEKIFPTVVKWDGKKEGTITKGTLLVEQMTSLDLENRQYKIVDHVDHIPQQVFRNIVSILGI
ncbi:type II toxin-antitoxin system PemK/MazF family toxin [Limosilactobacillus sp. RRLNB_1_1]|uniref:Type II toxin-antitoxin system PemK/MazF family toxin n=1 Tax=Limosilactobacillus albertensis TaxID=2759752 RepID=A0A7W3TRS3_9LACO|nr:type II toxin-antitoxin system PemK/MazF family toxin [Limosilactobacillus albertensis]MBB1069710.1 type II toxin-antitoxin system PemK/MazF family toxin [Limosilactobacillus albertensis]MCD7117828.1 type II toxin-antitoxin system PemK/MazF family toxin [Limosilactobacillus albertensis]MCD7128462.1 type II toxin-antitoxin system PemK/MazF family toxin [Limosilactobacillus albertensis]